MAIFKVYNRYHNTFADEVLSLDSAKGELSAGSDGGEIFAIGIYDSETKTAYIDGPHAIGFGADDALKIIAEKCGPIEHVEHYRYEVPNAQELQQL